MDAMVSVYGTPILPIQERATVGRAAMAFRDSVS
jgi:hypothetical protein